MADLSGKKYLPMMMDVTEKSILLIGAGNACAEKLRTLLSLDMQVTVISDSFLPVFQNNDKLKLIERKYTVGDMQNFDIIYCGINDETERKKIRDEAETLGKLINFVDRPLESDFISASSLIYENFTIFISTYGKSPGGAKKIRETLEQKISLNSLNKEIGEMIKKRR